MTILNPQILARLPKQYSRADLIAKSKQLNAAMKSETPIGVIPRPDKCAGAMVFTLENGARWCMNCGGSHE